jgi:hypothetical protein
LWQGFVSVRREQAVHRGAHENFAHHFGWRGNVGVQEDVVPAVAFNKVVHKDIREFRI